MRSDAHKREAAPSEVWALTEAEREAVHVIVCGHDEPGRTKCPGGSLCCCEEVIAHMLATVSRIKAEAVQAERERWLAALATGLGAGMAQAMIWDAADRLLAAEIARGEGR